MLTAINLFLFCKSITSFVVGYKILHYLKKSFTNIFWKFFQNKTGLIKTKFKIQVPSLKMIYCFPVLSKLLIDKQLVRLKWNKDKRLNKTFLNLFCKLKTRMSLVLARLILTMYPRQKNKKYIKIWDNHCHISSHNTITR